ncbi:MAG: hypothetical protein AAF944_22430 [Bacteroidota bacterium]
MRQPDLKTALLLIFAIFLLLLQFPLLSIANQAALVAGIPQFYLYIFGVWSLMIGLLVYLVEIKRLKP